MFNTVSFVSNICGTSIYQKLISKKIIFPFYHSISNIPQLHINSLYKTRSTTEFKNDLEFLLKNFQIIEPEKAFQLLRNNLQPKKPSFLLSFDDGLSSFYYVAAPILKEKGIPAIVFLNSDFVDNKDLFYRYKASLLINHLIENPEPIKIISVFFSDNGIVKANVFEAILSVNYQKSNLLDKAAKICCFSFTDFLNTYKPYLTTEQITELSEKGFLLGAHSINHPKYSEINFDEQIKQTRVSVETVKNKFNQPLSLFAFPFTDDCVSSKLFTRFFDEKNPIVDFSFGSAGIKNEEFNRHIQRIPMEGISASGNKIIKTEYLYYLLKSIVQKNTIYRS